MMGGGGGDIKPAGDDVSESGDQILNVDISDALSERDKVKFTVHTKTNIPDYQKTEFSVVRQHEEFVWLHDRFEENEEYAGYIIPPAPPRPDFDASREKLQKLGEGEGTMTKEEFTKMKQELEAEYLATFKKTVAMHEVFLTRLANHVVFRSDHNFRVFLEYDQELSVRGKNKKEYFGGIVKHFGQTTDEYVLSFTQKDVDEFFDKERTFIFQLYNLLKDSTTKSDRLTAVHKSVADSHIRIYLDIIQLATIDNNELEKFLTKFAETMEKVRKVENRVASDEDLKLSDTLRYYMRDAAAAKDLLYRRRRCLANYENANKALDKARAKNRDVSSAESFQQSSCARFEQLSDKAKEELQQFKVRRVQAFKKNLVELAELQIKHGRAQCSIISQALQGLAEA
ncbi:unnamed protein product [Allacma fusca]|uniref:Sorting nexin n=1 Tax=Allacma fusca TaxID=39272 RepID=A0A8J2LR95_9HEXA|nr:unnamed protein product [Allacma fusca]